MERIKMEEQKDFDRELGAILKLIQLTQDGVLKWRATKPGGDLFETETKKYTNVFHCNYEGKHLRIFTKSTRIDKPTTLMAQFLEGGGIARGQTYPYWRESLELEIINEQWNSLWQFPYKPATDDLLNAVKYSAAGVKDLLDSLLSKTD
jgi:hypothetical protein